LLFKLLKSSLIELLVIYFGSGTTKGQENYPFFMETQPAAEFMKRQIEANIGVISFPFMVYMIANWCGNLPNMIRDVLQHQVLSRQEAIEKLGPLEY